MSRPVLSEAFFTKVDLSAIKPILAEALNSYSGWSEHFFPIYRWNEVLYIGCVNDSIIPPDFPNQNVCFVIAPESELKKLYNALSGAPLLELSDDVLEAASTSDTTNIEEQENDLDLLSEDEKKNQLKPITSDSSEQIAITNRDFLNEKPAWDNLWSAIESKYQSASIAIIEQNNFYIFNNSENWPKKIKSDITSYNLNTASPFKIVSKTQRSFHGKPASNNECDQMFLKDYGFNNYPENLTVVPLFKNQGLMGFFICVGEQKTFNKECLTVAEGLAKQATLMIKKEIEQSKNVA